MQKSRDVWKAREKELVWIENCPFCDLNSQGDCVIWKGKYWYIQHNMYPYLWLKEHIMAVPFSHKTFTYELTSEEWSEFSEVQKFVKSFFWDREYFSFIRETLSNRSIEHLHYHFLPWVLRTSRIENILREQWY